MVYEILLPTSIFLDDQTLAPRLTFLPRVPALSGQCPAGVAECGAIAATPHMRLPRCAPELDGKTCETAGNNHIYIYTHKYTYTYMYIYIFMYVYI
jgi:hypothetical protein